MDREHMQSVPPVQNRRRPGAPRDRRAVDIPTEWAPDGREYLKDQIERLWHAVESLNEPMDRIASAIERLESMAERIEPIVKEWPTYRARMGLMWAGLALFLSGVMGVGFYLSGQWLHAELLPAVSVHDQRQAAREAILDIAPSIAVEGRMRGSGPRQGWPTVPALNRRLRQIDPSFPRIDALDRDVACRSAPETCAPRG